MVIFQGFRTRTHTRTTNFKLLFIRNFYANFLLTVFSSFSWLLASGPKYQYCFRLDQRCGTTNALLSGSTWFELQVRRARQRSVESPECILRLSVGSSRLWVKTSARALNHAHALPHTYTHTLAPIRSLCISITCALFGSLQVLLLLRMIIIWSRIHLVWSSLCHWQPARRQFLLSTERALNEFFSFCSFYNWAKNCEKRVRERETLIRTHTLIESIAGSALWAWAWASLEENGHLKNFSVILRNFELWKTFYL